MWTNCKINPHILRYIEMVENEEIKACDEQHLLVKHIRKCFETEDIYTDNEQLEKYLSLAKYFPFEKVFEWQEFFLGLHLCTYWEDSGMPRWPDSICLLGRGAGKDGTIAIEAMCLTSEHNNIRGYDVDICANNEEQATRPVKDVREALEDPANIKKMKKFFRWTKEEIESLKTKSIIKGRTNSPKGKDGLRSGVVILNEIHQYENFDNINVFTTGLGKKKHPRRSYYTTQGDVVGGPLSEILDTAENILKGGEDDDGLLPFICKLNKKEDVHDSSNWEMANPSLPYLPNLLHEIKKEYKEWNKNPSSLPAFMTKRMNLPQSKIDIPVAKIEVIAETNKEIPDLFGRMCVVGIDYTKTTDFASVNAHFREGDKRYDINHSFVCSNSSDLARIKAPWKKWVEDGLLTYVDDVEIHADIIADYIAGLCRKYNVLKIALDDYRCALLSNSLKTIGFDEKERKNIKRVRKSDIIKIIPVIDSCFMNGFFHWGDNPPLRWATNNTKQVNCSQKAKMMAGADSGNFEYAKIEGRSRKTDPFMALVASMTIEDELGAGVYSSNNINIGVYTY